MRKIPKIREVAAELRQIGSSVDWSDIQPEFEYEETGYLDVRLQFYSNGSWYIRAGDPQYDTDHRGLWASSVLWADMQSDDYHATARDLVGQIVEQVE